MSKPEKTNETCILCNKEVEGELQLHRNSVNYMLDNVIEHSCRSPEWYAERSRKQKSSAIERAMARLVSHPQDEKAARVLVDWRAAKLLEQAGKPGKAGLQAATKILKEFVGGRVESEQVDVMPDDYIEQASSHIKSLRVEMIESEPKPESEPKAVSEPAIIESTNEETVDEPPGWEPPIRDGEMLATHLDIHVMALADGRLQTYDPHYKPRQKGPFG